MDGLNRRGSQAGCADEKNPLSTVILGGVCGSGMIGLARMALQCGLQVRGCDRSESSEVVGLKAGGLKYFTENQIKEQSRVDLVVCSSALAPEHPLREWANEHSVPVWTRARFLAYLLREREIILVTGTHGKTTTAVLLAHALKKSGRDCSFYIGAEVPLLGTSAYLGSDSLAVVEADESDGSFEVFDPAHVLVLNIEEDHLDHYAGMKEIVTAFQKVIDKCTGRVVLCQDDPVVRESIHGGERKRTYGFHPDSEYRALEWLPIPDGGTELMFRDLDQADKRLRLGLKGKHNALNVLGAMALLDGVVPSDTLAEDLFEGVTGARRRFEVRGESKWGKVIDDYAHHPSEIRATLETARNDATERLVCIFQPHRFSRTEKLMSKFGEAFEKADKVYLAPVYGAGEKGEAQMVSQKLGREVEVHHPDVTVGESLGAILGDLRKDWQEGDTVCFLGAGDITDAAGMAGDEISQAGELSRLLGNDGRCQLYEPMSKHTTLRVGGPVDAWVEVASSRILREIINYAKTRTKYLKIIGRGTNLLVKDGGIRGICLHLKGGEFDEIQISGSTVRAGAGVRLKKIVQEAKKLELGGFEFMEGIPGNVGGALCMNAGAMQSWMFEVVESVKVMSPDGEIKHLSRDEVQAGYRDVPLFRDHIALEAELSGENMPREVIEDRLKKYSEKRWSSQPAKPSAGCSFKNPGEIPAGRLIEELTLKGRKIGGAEVSSVHGNFIVNDGQASAKDVLDLIAMIQDEAQKKRGIKLEPEVIILGEDEL